MDYNLMMSSLDFNKYPDGLMPVIIQDSNTNKVLMLGFMNKDAFHETITTNLVTFYSRSKNRLWTKGETSKNFLHLINVFTDCDSDTMLIKVSPDGPVCHTGADTCFSEKNKLPFLMHLENVINDRYTNRTEASYIASLFNNGLNAIAQKVGEEAVELIIEAKDNDDLKFKNEAADLLFHYLVLLRSKGCSISDITSILESRAV